MTGFLYEILKLARQGEFPCFFRLLTGAYCPGCGGTRAVTSLLHGHFLESVLYHPLVLYLAVVLPLLSLWYVWCRTQKKPFSQKVWKTVLYAGLFILTLNFLVKNYLLLFQKTDILALLDESAGRLKPLLPGWHH